jgi:hypothetical protein
MAGLVSAIHGLRVDPAEIVDASLRWHDGNHTPKGRFHGSSAARASDGMRLPPKPNRLRIALDSF